MLIYFLFFTRSKAHETEIVMNTAPTTAKKRQNKNIKQNINRYTPTIGKTITEQESIIKSWTGLA